MNIKYFLVFTTPLLTFLSMKLGGYWSFTVLIYVFGLVPVLDSALKGTSQNLDDAAEAAALQNKGYDYLVWAFVPIQFALLSYYLFRISAGQLLWWEKVGMTTAMALSCAGIGINIAHELGHRVTKHEQWMSKALLCTSLYMHFFIEHNRGHHKNVSTDEDPASARYGETLYAFVLRSVRDSWLSAWKLEEKRLLREGQKVWSLHNEMLRYQIIQVLFLGAIALIFDWKTMLWFSVAAVMGFCMLENVNYIEHYGLRRKKINEKAYERVQPIHSWNSNHSLGRILLLELTRHSDHHYKASRKYQILRHFEEAPQMPAGYPAMMLLALIPPLWFSVMHKQIAKYELIVDN